MNSEILNFLVELSTKDAEKFISNLRYKKMNLNFKLADSEKVEKAQIYATPFFEKFGLMVRKDFHLKEANVVTFKVTMGTDLFFFKTKIVVEKAAFFITAPFKIFKLVRRKHTRYIIPEFWAQSGFIVSSDKKMLNSKIQLLEMSLSGIRIHILTELPRYEKNQKIKLQFKLHRRPVITVDAVIQHIKYSYKGGQLIGVQFVQETLLMKSKIANICDDLILHLA